MDREELIEKFGSWVRVQVAFYDFLFKGPYTTNESEIEKIEMRFSSFSNAWLAFNVFLKQSDHDEE